MASNIYTTIQPSSVQASASCMITTNAVFLPSTTVVSVASQHTDAAILVASSLTMSQTLLKFHQALQTLQIHGKLQYITKVGKMIKSFVSTPRLCLHLDRGKNQETLTRLSEICNSHYVRLLGALQVRHKQEVLNLPGLLLHIVATVDKVHRNQ